MGKKDTKEQLFEDTSLSSNMEDYVEAIEVLSKKKKVVRVKDIAKDLKIKMPSVTAALQKLEEKGLINYERYGYIDLTNKGRKIAEKVYSRHSFLTDFFHTVLKIDKKRADDVGCRIEHHLSSEACRQIFKLLEFYKSECKRIGAERRQIQGIDDSIFRVKVWRKNNPEKCKIPDVYINELRPI